MIKFIIATLFIVLFSAGLSGCANVIKTNKVLEKPIKAVYLDRKAVLRGLERNYSKFGGISGRLTLKIIGSGFSFEQEGLYKYIKGRCIKLTIFDPYGDVLFYGKLNKNGKAAYFYPRLKRTNTVSIDKEDKKYKGTKLAIKRIFDTFKIILNLNSLKKIKNSTVFYNTANGYFFDRISPAVDYYISVNKRFFIDRITEVKDSKIIESAMFKDFILNSKGVFPSKIFVDDYLYNVKIELSLSKKSKAFSLN